MGQGDFKTVADNSASPGCHALGKERGTCAADGSLVTAKKPACFASFLGCLC